MIAGILAGLEVLVPTRIFQIIDDYLLGNVKDTETEKGSLRWIWIILNILLVIGIILIIEIPAFNKDIKNGVFNTHILANICSYYGVFSWNACYGGCNAIPRF